MTNNKDTANTLKKGIPTEVGRLIQAYPSYVIGYSDNKVILNDGTTLIYDNDLVENEQVIDVDIKSIFTYPYKKGKILCNRVQNYDPGRTRSTELLKKMYGSTAKEAARNLVKIAWCPRQARQELWVTKANDVHLHLQEISMELDKHNKWKKYLKSGGTFSWRPISGTNRLSPHSFGIAIDLNPNYASYWKWDHKDATKSDIIDCSNISCIPMEIVDIFEKYGFIWGGKWYHYDTMHFEYRPELLIG